MASLSAIEIETYVIFKVETTDRPWDGGNKTRIVEICCIPVRKSELRENMENLEDFDKFHYVVDPERAMGLEASQATGICDEELSTQQNPTFSQVYDEFETFLAGLPKPILLVAHNGNAFDFRMLQFECNLARKSLPEDLLCTDSLNFFRFLLKGTQIKKNLPALYSHYSGAAADPAGYMLRAEDKASMLLEIISRNANAFMTWAGMKSKNIGEVQEYYPQTQYLDNAEYL